MPKPRKRPNPLRRPNSSIYFFWWTGEHGKRRRVSTGCDNLRDAEKFIDEFVMPLQTTRNVRRLTDIAQDLISERNTTTLVGAFDVWLTAPKRKEPSDRQIAEKRSMWKDFCAYAAAKGHALCRDIDRPFAAAYIQHLRTHGRWVRETTYERATTKKTTLKAASSLSSARCNKFLMTLRQVFQATTDHGTLPNPFDGIPKAIHKPVTREAFTREELAGLLAAADDFTRPILIIGACTGLRLADVCTLRWSEVNLPSGWIRRTMSKTGREVRIPIMDRLATLLRGLPRTQTYVLPEHAACFPKSGTMVTEAMRKLIEATGLETRQKRKNGRAASVRGTHSLRHTFIWLAAEAGIPMPVVQGIVGHMTPAMTKLYADHATDESSRKAMQILGDPFTGRRSSPLAGITSDDLLTELEQRWMLIDA